MYSSCCAVFSALLLISPVVALHADSAIDESVMVTFQDWSGSLQQTMLPDGSVLSEYVARTHSGNTSGAALLVSFSPRFGCSPAVSILLPSESAVELAQSATLMLTIDEEQQDLPTLIDVGESVVRYSLNAETNVHLSVRKKLDNASRATVSWALGEQQTSSTETAVKVDEAVTVTQQGGDSASVSYSLLGSRMTVKEIEKLCVAHEPIPFDN